MRTAEELRYLILAIQRGGSRLLTSDLRPLGLTPSQAEALRVLEDHQPLSLSGLGSLLVCETGDNPSRLVDRLVGAGLVRRDADPADRRHVTLSLTPDGRALAREVAAVEEQLHQTIETVIDGLPLEGALTLLRRLAAVFPNGQALARRQRQQEHTTPPPSSR